MAGLLYYVTYKYVLLKDSRLGLLYYILALLTVLYTVVEIFVKKGYMEVYVCIYSTGCIAKCACLHVEHDMLVSGIVH